MENFVKKKLISIVVPVYNEEENVIDCYNALVNLSTQLTQYHFEFLFTDNDSTDSTYSILESLSKNDNRIRVYSFSRNFGYQRSIYTGYLLSRGDAVIAFDCDLQDPPGLVIEFISLWEQSYKVVYGIRCNREESYLTQTSRKLFYRLINKISEEHLPPDAGDFRLLDRCIVEQLRQINDYQPYLRGIIATLGFAQIGVPYERKKRLKGKSKFPWRKMFGLAIDGIISQSVVPLRLATYTGLIISVVTLIAIFFYGLIHVFNKTHWPAGFTTTTLLLLFSISLNALFLGIIGEYLGRLYHQVKSRPLTITEKHIDTTT